MAVAAALRGLPGLLDPAVLSGNSDLYLHHHCIRHLGFGPDRGFPLGVTDRSDPVFLRVRMKSFLRVRMKSERPVGLAVREKPGRRSVVGAAMTIKGEVRGGQDLLVLGRIEGRIFASRMQHHRRAGSLGQGQPGGKADSSRRLCGRAYSGQREDPRDRSRPGRPVSLPKWFLEKGCRYSGAVDTGVETQSFREMTRFRFKWRFRRRWDSAGMDRRAEQFGCGKQRETASPTGPARRRLPPPTGHAGRSRVHNSPIVTDGGERRWRSGPSQSWNTTPRNG